MISVSNITKAFGTVQALRGVSTEFPERNTTVIVGPSGSGKSTLLRCLNLLEVPDSGTLTIDDAALTFPARLSRADRAQAADASTMVFQSFNLFPHLTVRDNVALALRQYIRRNRDALVGDVTGSATELAQQIAQNRLEQVGLADKGDAYPSQLSGGQQQRVAIARALAVSPTYLLCYEPTSALDPELAVEVSRVLIDVARSGQSLVIVTHDLAFARRVADRLIFLDEGVIGYDGEPSGFFGSTDPRIRDFLAIFEI